MESKFEESWCGFLVSVRQVTFLGTARNRPNGPERGNGAPNVGLTTTGIIGGPPIRRRRSPARRSQTKPVTRFLLGLGATLKMGGA